MAKDVEISLCDYLKTCKFSIQLDESTQSNNEALLSSYVRFIKEEKIHQGLLFAKKNWNLIKREKLYLTPCKKKFKRKKFLFVIFCLLLLMVLSNTGCHKGFIAHLKQAVPNVLAIYCIIHSQHLVANILIERLHTSLHYVIKAINKIRSNSLNDRLFNKLCNENDEDYNRLLLHTEVRWLSKGVCLNCFFNLFHSVLHFLEDREKKLHENLITSKNDIAYLTDLFKIL